MRSEVKMDDGGADHGGHVWPLASTLRERGRVRAEE